MKIAFLAPIEVNDCDRLVDYISTGKPLEKADSFLTWLIYSYLQEGHRVSLIALSPKRELSFSSDQLDIHVFKLFNHGNVRALFNFSYDIRKIRDELLKTDYDVIHAHWCYEYAAAALKADKEHTIISMHDWPDAIQKYLHNFYWRRRLNLGRKVIAKGEIFTAVSPYIFEGLKTAGKTSDMIPNYIRSEFFREEPKEINNLAPTFMMINNGFSEHKNVSAGILAFQKIKEFYPKAKLLLYGNEHEENGIAHQWAKEHECTNGVYFMGWAPSAEIMRKLQEVDVLISTSKEESFGLTLIEAMASKALVAAGAESGAVPWVLDYGKAGILIDIYDPQDIAQKVVEILQHKSECQTMIDYAYSYAKKEFSFEEIKKKYFEVYNRHSCL